MSIVAHDRFQEIVDEAKNPDSKIRLKAIVLDAGDLEQKTSTVVSQPQLESKLGIAPTQMTSSTIVAGASVTPTFAKPADQKAAQLAYVIIKKLSNQPQTAPSLSSLSTPAVHAEIVKAVTEQLRPTQLEIEGVVEKPDIAAIVAKTTELVQQQTIQIPRIQVVPTGVVRSGFRPFTLDLSVIRYAPPSEELWREYLRTGAGSTLTPGAGGIEESRLENYVVSGLVDFNDISYDEHADLLYDLAGQMVQHLLTYLSDADAAKVLRCYQRDIAAFIHARMEGHFWEEVGGYETKVNAGFTELKQSAYTVGAGDPVLDYRVAPGDRNNMARYLFGGFAHCLYSVEKFQSDSERRLAVILEREQAKWFKPRKGQFQLFYRLGSDHFEYQPDFVAETGECILMLEPKASNQMHDADVLAKRDVAVRWCELATEYSRTTGGKPWKYALIPHDVITDNMTVQGLVEIYG